ncbi:hypothetical protein [Couchioplanes caeruleus]|uniref:hypothetical protein n=1 Tax=Couchioplanes caeruleus TaxID=56438 RepID=UPI0011CD4202|nr:hypothetical protein [Couchioplanes caeruleus]
MSTPVSLRAWRRRMARFAAVAVTTTAILAALLAGGSGAASAAGARFVPEATDADWDGAVATVVFQEVEVALESGVTSISVKATADVDIVCTRGESTITIHRSATATEVDDYPISDDGTVAGIARLPLKVTGLQVPGYSCAAQRWSVTAVLEDFWTGATLVHKA